MASEIFSVPEISCDHCVAAITEQVAPLSDVESVAIDVDNKTVTVDGGTVSEIVAAIDEAGFDATQLWLGGDW